MQFFTSAASAALGSASPLSISVLFSRQPAAAPPPPPPPAAGGASASASAAAAAPALLPTYASGEAVSGEIKLMVASGKRVEHAGVRLELKGVVEAATEKAPYEFLSLVQEVSGAGALTGLQSLPFTFPAVDFPVESYGGAKARVRYVLRAIVATRGGGFGGGGGEQRREAEFTVRTPHASAPALGGSGGVDAAALAADPDAPILLEVGIEDCLHIEFQYSRMRYHLADTVTGHIDFKQLGIKLRKMEVAVVRKENVGTREWGRREGGGG
jgi:vacuolar protein sorting-associated protein 26